MQLLVQRPCGATPPTAPVPPHGKSGQGRRMRVKKNLQGGRPNYAWVRVASRRSRPSSRGAHQDLAAGTCTTITGANLTPGDTCHRQCVTSSRFTAVIDSRGNVRMPLPKACSQLQQMECGMSACRKSSPVADSTSGSRFMQTSNDDTHSHPGIDTCLSTPVSTSPFLSHNQPLAVPVPPSKMAPRRHK